MKRKEFLKLMGAGTGTLTLSPILFSCRMAENENPNLSGESFTRQLVFPEEIDASDFELAAEIAERKLINDAVSDVYTLNGSLPSPTIRVKRGETLDINFQNRLNEESILHWHGLTVPPEMDGHPKDAVESGEAYDYHFDISQRAATLWYHPHPHGRTGSQIYHGLAGFFIIEDEEEQTLNLPSGEYELLLNIQEKQIDEQGRAVYSLNMMDRMMNEEDGMMDRMMMQEDLSTEEAVPVIEFRINKEEENPFQLPGNLVRLSFPDEADAERTRRFDLSMEMMQGSSINGRFFEMLRVDEEVPRNALEIWEFSNDRMMPHPMHIHATQFKVLNRSNGNLAPDEHGWKDNVLVDTGETVRVLVKFDAPGGMYVFHCHNLEHSDNGMMANFEITS